MGLDIGDDIMYVLSVSRCEDQPILLVWIDQAEAAKSCITEIDRTTTRVQEQLRTFVSYRFTPSDFWRRAFDVRKQIWDT